MSRKNRPKRSNNHRALNQGRPLSKFPTQEAKEDRTIVLSRKVVDSIKIFHVRISLGKAPDPSGLCPLCSGDLGEIASLAFTDRGALSICLSCGEELASRGVSHIAYKVKSEPQGS